MESLTRSDPDFLVAEGCGRLSVYCSPHFLQVPLDSPNTFSYIEGQPKTSSYFVTHIPDHKVLQEDLHRVLLVPVL